ncbi:iron ABC transporter permease [Paenibacillus sp. CF384]|uniref:FecCD family ABC transporter permease n=1 Tax=Paenibacillus sp. CF384 TaxID=1884382 RepID=UPI0008975F9E|nr:iron ABC transporter permease [Paenibacillus sp. CF384]SDX07615.1 iron complex transport system permease protein [Paenibacillus sp. CF384]
MDIHTKMNVYRSAGLIASCLLLLLSVVSSICFGFVSISLKDLAASFASYDETIMEQVVVRTARLPRAVIAAAVGASLALAGAVLQSVTRNPLASPSVLGINAGASVAVVAAITVMGIRDTEALMWFAFGGAALAAGMVFALGSLGREGLSPLKIILAGAALTALFSSLTQGMLAHNENGLQEVLFWLSGSVAGRTTEMLLPTVPYMAAGIALSFVLSKHWNVIALGEESAKGLGQHLLIVKAVAGVIVILLAGSAVAVAGPIGLVGIIVPHIAKRFAGNDYRWRLPFSAVLGATLLVLADLAARFLHYPIEIPVGIMTAAIGAPFFIYIARKERAKE